MEERRERENNPSILGGFNPNRGVPEEEGEETGVVKGEEARKGGEGGGEGMSSVRSMISEDMRAGTRSRSEFNLEEKGRGDKIEMRKERNRTKKRENIPINQLKTFKQKQKKRMQTLWMFRRHPNVFHIPNPHQPFMNKLIFH